MDADQSSLLRDIVLDDQINLYEMKRKSQNRAAQKRYREKLKQLRASSVIMETNCQEADGSTYDDASMGALDFSPFWILDNMVSPGPHSNFTPSPAGSSSCPNTMNFHGYHSTHGDSRPKPHGPTVELLPTEYLARFNDELGFQIGTVSTSQKPSGDDNWSLNRSSSVSLPICHDFENAGVAATGRKLEGFASLDEKGLHVTKTDTSIERLAAQDQQQASVEIDSAILTQSHLRMIQKACETVDRLADLYNFGIEMHLLTQDEELRDIIASLKYKFRRSANRAVAKKA